MQINAAATFWAPLTSSQCSNIQAFASLVSLVVLGLLFWQLRLNIKQMKQTLNWNKMSATFGVLDFDRYLNIRRAAFDACLKMKPKIELAKPNLTKEEAEQILNDPDADLAINRLVGFMEHICTAYRSGLLHESMLQTTFGFEIIKWNKKLKEYIVLRQQSDREAFIDFTTTASSLPLTASATQMVLLEN